MSCICAMGVNTAIHHDALNADDEVSQLGANVVVKAGSVLEPEEVASTLAATEEERFLILPHSEVLEYYRCRGSDYDRWLARMRRLHREAAKA